LIEKGVAGNYFVNGNNGQKAGKQHTFEFKTLCDFVYQCLNDMGLVEAIQLPVRLVLPKQADDDDEFDC
jgi:hypothetical protein